MKYLIDKYDIYMAASTILCLLFFFVCIIKVTGFLSDWLPTWSNLFIIFLFFYAGFSDAKLTVIREMMGRSD